MRILRYYQLFYYILFLGCSMQLYAQPIATVLSYKAITREDGLPHNYVHSVTQDGRGFIWIATNYGLVRYDGYSYKTFQPNASSPFSITHKAIGTVFADTKERIWLSVTTGGVNRMDIQTEHFKGYFKDGLGKRDLGFEVRSFYEDSDSVIWMATDSGLFRYNQEKDLFDDVLEDRLDGTGRYVWQMTDDLCGHLWIVFGTTLKIFDKVTFKISSLNEFLAIPNHNTIEVGGVFCNQKGTVWLATKNMGLIAYEVLTKKSTTYLKSIPNLANVYLDKFNNVYAVSNNPQYKLFTFNNELYSAGKFKEYNLFDSKVVNRFVNFIEDKNGCLWISCFEGVKCFHIEKGFVNSLVDSKTAAPLGDIKIENLFIDRTHNLWISSSRTGIYKADLSQKPFNVYNTSYQERKLPNFDRNVSSVFVDSKEYLWIGQSKNGVSCIDPQNGNYYRFYLNSGDPVTSIYEEGNGYYWFGTYWSNLFRVKIPNLKHLPVNSEIHIAETESFNIVGVRKIVKGVNSSNLWMATVLGVVEWNSKSGEFINHSLLYDSLAVKSGFCRTVFVDDDRFVWSGSNGGGLARYDIESKQFKHYYLDGNRLRVQDNLAVYSISKTKSGHFLIGTSKGLFQFNPTTELSEQILFVGVDAYSSIFSVFIDVSGDYWMSSEIGVIRYNPLTNSALYYGKYDGLLNNDLNTTASFISNDLEIFYGGTGGLISFFPKDIRVNPFPAKPAITNFMINNIVVTPGDTVNKRVILDSQIWKVSRLKLNYYENDFSFEFSALHYSVPEKNRYQYRLKGLHNQWISLDASRRWATFTGLQPGEYTLEMRATNNDGIMCAQEDEVKLFIEITPPFWKTKLFIGAFLLLIIVTIVVSWNYRIKYLNAQKVELKRQVAERTNDLEKSNALLEHNQKELAAKNENLVFANQLLEERQEEIRTQNDELLLHRNHLEKLVKMKTHDLEKALAKSEESDRLKSAFLENLSHEVRTPMNAIIGFTNLLGTATSVEERDEFIQTITENSDALLALIDDMVDISLIQSDQIKIYTKTVDVLPMLRNILTRFNSRNSKKLEILLDDKVDVLVMNTDIHRLEQVFDKLMSNAMKFTDAGFIAIKYDLLDQFVRFSVEDTGIGIPSCEYKKIFNIFYKNEMIEGRIFRGTGLGLAISNHLVKLLGGELTVSSQVGKGSVFSFSIPR